MEREMIVHPLFDWEILVRRDTYPIPPRIAAFIMDTLFRSKRWQRARFN